MSLTKLFGRVRKNTADLRQPEFLKLLQALQTANMVAAQQQGGEIVDYNGNVVDKNNLETRAAKLEAKVRRAWDRKHARSASATLQASWTDRGKNYRLSDSDPDKDSDLYCWI